MASTYAQLVAQLQEAVLASPGTLDPAVRRAASELGGLDAEQAAFVQAIDQHAHRITDEDVRALGRTLSDDQVFELAVSASLGASMRRLEAGLEALRAASQEVAR